MDHNQGKSRMEYETVIAAYETVQGADAVVRDLKKAGVAADGIGRHVKGAAAASNRSELLATRCGFPVRPARWNVNGRRRCGIAMSMRRFCNIMD